jgi:hypothetical protein
MLTSGVQRFEQNAGKITLTKIDTYTEFPEELDMTPYLSSRVLRYPFSSRSALLFHRESSLYLCLEQKLERSLYLPGFLCASGTSTIR